MLTAISTSLVASVYILGVTLMEAWARNGGHVATLSPLLLGAGIRSCGRLPLPLRSTPPPELLLAQPSQATEREASVWLLPSKDVVARTVYGHLIVAHMAALTTIQGGGGREYTPVLQRTVPSPLT